jgi:hypothetical protein
VVTIRTGPIAEVVQQRLVERGLSLAARIPVDRLDREITVVDSPELAQASRALGILQSQAVWMPLLAGVVLAGAIALAADRRKAVLWSGIGALLATVLPLQAILLGRVPVIRYFEGLGSGNGAAAQAAYDIVFRDLIAVERTIALLAALVFVGAVLVGPSRGALALRSALAGGLSTAGARFDFGRFGEFVSHNKMTLRGAGLFVTALIGVVPLDPGGSRASLVVAVVALLVWIGAIEFFGGAPGASANPPQVATEEPNEP